MATQRISVFTRIGQLPFMIAFFIGAVVGLLVAPFVLGLSAGVEIRRTEWLERKE